MDSILKHFSEYLYCFEISGTDIYYTPYLYDLLDQDLDFDEYYYEKMMANLDKMLHEEAKQACQEQPITIVKVKMLSRAKTEMEKRKSYRYDSINNRIEIEETYFETTI